jgi:benzoyl-CoA reductase/2-hydroxyglutaryl-CoA dehydratase subunit BcrC/BadD/HgdB
MALFLSSPQRVRASGKKVVAKGALSPVDLVYAAGALAYDPYTHETIVHSVMNEKFNIVNDAVNAGVSSDFNPWNLAMLGAVISKKNEVPIDMYSTACGCWDDQTTKSWQIMSQATASPLRFWEIPRFDPETEEWAIDYLRKELKQLFDWMTVYTGQEVTDGTLRDAIRHGNMLRQDMLEITKLLQLHTVPIPALEFYITQALMGDYVQDPEALHAQYRALIEELEERVKKAMPAPGVTSEKPLRIYFMGEETQEFRVWNAIEDYGGVLVGSDTRLSLYYDLIKEDGSPIENLARWIWEMPYNLPTTERIKATIPYIKEQNPDAIIVSSVVGSRNLPGAERLVKDLIRDELGIPQLSIETPLPLENLERVDYQIKAFIEMNL